MGKVTRLSVVVLVLLVAGLSRSPAATVTSPPKPDYSKEAAVIENYRTTFQFQNDGKYTEDITVRVKIRSTAGVQQYGVLGFKYFSASMHMQIDSVRVRQPDGTIVATPPSSYQDVTPQVTLAAPEYSDLREKHVAVKGLVPGSVLEYHVRFHAYSPLAPGQFWLAYNFAKTAIVLDEELEVSLPSDRAVKVKSTSVRPAITTEGDRRIYLWKTANLKNLEQQAYPLGRVPPPDVLLSSFESWAQVGEWWGHLAQPQMAPTAAVRSKAAELTKGLTTEQQKLQAIYSYVASQFRYISISFGVGRYQPHRANQVLGNGYGDCKDKATLLDSLLAAAGINSWPALVNSSDRIDPDVPSPGQFDHVITVVPEGNKLQWMDTTTELAPLGLLTFNLRGKQALVIPNAQPAYLAATPVQPSVPNREVFRAKGKLTSDGTFTGKIHYTVDGDAAVFLRLVFNNAAQSDWEKTVQGMMQMQGFGGTVSNLQVSSPQDTTHPFSFSFDYVPKNYSDWADKRITPPFPFADLPGLPQINAQPPQPLVLGDPEDLDFSAMIELPKGYAPTIPKPLDLTRPFASYHSADAFKDGILTAKRRASTTIEEVPVTQLDAYRKFQKAVSDNISSYIALTSGSGSTMAAAPASPEFLSDLRTAAADWSLQDYQGSLDAVNRALKLNPNHERVWLMAASLDMNLQEPDDATAALRKAIKLAPNDIRPLKMITRVLTMAGNQDEIILVWRDFVQRNPQNPQGHSMLAAALMLEKKYAQAVPEMEAATKLSPTNPNYVEGLAEALAKSGNKRQAAVVYEKAVQMDPTPKELNEASYRMAEVGLDLPKAERWAAQAVKAEETRTDKISLATLSDDDLRQMPTLAGYWDELAWVYLHEGKWQEARKYAVASYALNQLPLAADYLGQIDEKLGRRVAAISDYAEALAETTPMLQHKKVDQAVWFPWVARDRQSLRRLLGSTARQKSAVVKAQDEPSNLRTYSISKAGLKPGTADFFVLLSPGEKKAEVKFISGSEKLRGAADRIAALQYRDSFPDKGPTKILRRGVLTCNKGIASCDFVVLPVDSVRSVE